MAVKYARPRGTQDILPADSSRWQYMEEIIRREVAVYGYGELRLPTFEHTEVFSRGVGDTTDVVNKEMYTFLDKGGRSVTLRPEGTAAVARAVLENGVLGSAAMPFKAYYLQNCFRYERVQKGRLREFHQLGVECYGTHDPLADAEVIALGARLLGRLGLRQVRLELNSIGCKHCRPAYHAALKDFFAARAGELCDTCRERLDRNPMRILDCKNESCQAIAANAPVALDYLCEDCRAHFAAVKAHLEALGVPYTVNPTIVRGLDYYSNTVFEFVHTAVGAQGTVCGGGRYDGLIEDLGGPATPAVGFGMGLERLLLALEAEGVALPAAPGPVVYLANIGEAGRAAAVKTCGALRAAGLWAECDLVGRGLKAQMKYADKLGARYTMVLGDDEVAAGAAQLKEMATGATREVPLAQLAEALGG